MKIKNVTKLFLFCFLVFLTNCEKEPSTEISYQADNSHKFSKLLASAKSKKECYNNAAFSSTSRGIDASFEATYGTPTFDKTIHLTNTEGMPILVIPLKDSGNDVINLLIGYENQNIEEFRILNPTESNGTIIQLGSGASTADRCPITKIDSRITSSLFAASDVLIDESASRDIFFDFSTMPEGCWQLLMGETECTCFIQINCSTVGGGGGNGAGDGGGTSDGGGTGTGTGSGAGDTGGGYTGGGDSGGGGAPGGGGADCGEEVFAENMPCESLKKLTEVVNQNIKPSIDVLKSYATTYPIIKENGFLYKKNSDGTRTNEVLSPPLDSDSSIKVQTGQNVFAAAHTHTFNLYPMYTWSDLYTLFFLHLNAPTDSKNDVTFFLVAAYDNSSPANVYSLKIDNINTFNSKLNADLTNSGSFGLTEEEKIEKADRLFNKIYEGDISVTDLEVLFLQNISGYGISLYQANSDLSNWEKLGLTTSTVPTVTRTPCN